MTEKEIQLLGFEKCENNDGINPFHYYVYDIANGFSFISCANDEIDKNGEWFIKFFNSDPKIRFDKMEEVQSLINLVEKRIVK